MKKNILVLIATFISYSAMAGGMIGGGEVTFKTLMMCDAYGIDPTHEASPYVSVVKEVDYDGNFIKDATLRVVTLNNNLQPVLYYVAGETDLVQDPDLKWSLNILMYENGIKIGQFVWDDNANEGSLKSLIGNEVEELQLSNCIFEL